MVGHREASTMRVWRANKEQALNFCGRDSRHNYWDRQLHPSIGRRASWSSLLDQEWAQGPPGIGMKELQKKRQIANYQMLEAKEEIGKEVQAAGIGSAGEGT